MNDYLEKYEDALFKAAIYEAAKDEYDQLMQEVFAKKVPSEFEMKKFLKKLDVALKKENTKVIWKGFKRVITRVAIAVMIFITISFTLIMSVDAMREWFTHLLLTFTPGYAEIQIQEQNSQGNNAENGKIVSLTGDCLPTYIPEGFFLKNLDMSENHIDACYSNTGGMIFDLMCYSESTDTQVDTEEADKIVSITINGNPGILIEKNSQFTVSWAVKGRYFVLLSQLQEKETLKIADSVIVK